MLYVAIAGAFGSGCTTSAEYLKKEYRFKHISLSSILRDFYNLPKGLSRSEMQNYGDKIRKTKGSQILMQLALDKFLGSGRVRKAVRRVVIETVRNPEEVRFLRNLIPHCYVLALYASEEDRMRWTNVKNQQERDEFLDADMRDSGDLQPEYGQQVTDCVNMADYFINNDKDKGKAKPHKLYDDLGDFFKIVSGEASDKVEKAVLMSHAFMQRLLSKCQGRRVGAVIADGLNVISTGWNGVPEGISDCKVCRRKELLKCEGCRDKEIQITLAECSCGYDNRRKRSLLEKHLDLCYAVHAEERAILRAIRKGISLKGTTLYCTTFPCLMCAKMILEVGIKKVVYVEPYPHSESERIFELAKAKAKDQDFDFERYTGLTARHLYGLHARGD